MGCSHFVINCLCQRQRKDQWMAGQCPDGVTSSATPCCLGSQCLIFSQHLQQPHQVTRHVSLGERLDSMSVDISRNLHHQIIGEVIDRAAARHIHRPHFLTVIEHRVHHV